MFSRIKIISISAAMIMSATSSDAAPKDNLNELLKSTDFCSSLKFDSRDVLKFLGIDVPAIIPPGATTVGIDKEAHSVQTLDGSAGGKLKSNIEVGCKPSDEAALVKLIGGGADRFRIKDNADCEGNIQADYSIPDLQCKMSGEGAKFLSKINNFDEKMKPLFQKALKPQ